MLSADPYDALLICSFGGPNRPEDVLPFLRNVVHGKGVPDGLFPPRDGEGS